MKPENSTVLITGGAAGLGAAVAAAVVARGGAVVIADLNEPAGQRLAAELGERAVFVKCNVSDVSDVSAAIDAAERLTRPFRAVVNCAGIVDAAKVVGREGPHPLDRFTKVIEVNLVGTFNVIRLAAARLVTAEPGVDGERGVIVNTASVAAYEGQIGQAAYAASKAGVGGMTLPLARELARHGIRVMAIAPGAFDTPMMAGMPEEVRAGLIASIPFPSRLGNPAEFAALAVHIMENSMLNGEIIRIDGAMRMK
jgi:NAD(P)-dependent dehydrogenase (short-subunit alcohol dehydrogenase family)